MIKITIRNYRLKKHLTQKELAALVGVKQTTIAYYESGSGAPSVKVAKKLGNVFNVPWYKVYD